MIGTISGLPLQLALLCAAHFIGDFAFQSAWMAAEKAKSLEVLFYHVATYSGAFVALALIPGTHVTMVGLAANFCFHFAIDYAKGRGWVKTIWQDQSLHLASLGLLVALGWM